MGPPLPPQPQMLAAHSVNSSPISLCLDPSARVDFCFNTAPESNLFEDMPSDN